MAIVGDEAHAGGARRMGALALHGGPGHRDLALGAAIDTGDGAQEFALAFAFDAGQTDDLTRAHRQIDGVETGARHRLHFELRRTDFARFRREHLRQGPPGDARDDIGHGEIARGARIHHLAVADDRNAIGLFGDFMQAVRNVDDGHALLPQRLDQIEELADIGLLERLGRLVKEQNLWLGRQSAHDLDHMTLRQSEIADALIELHFQLLGRDQADQARRLGGTARLPQVVGHQLQIFEDGQVGGQRRMLIGNRHTQIAHAPRAGRGDGLAVAQNFARIARQDAGGDADQVDLPAPFSPTMACTSPGAAAKETPLSARTAAKDFSMPRNSRTGDGVMPGEAMVLLLCSVMGSRLPQPARHHGQRHAADHDHEFDDCIASRFRNRRPGQADRDR